MAGVLSQELTFYVTVITIIDNLSIDYYEIVLIHYLILWMMYWLWWKVESEERHS